jgi:NADP-dependent 3-hydroxy acid dehydrogenase YdfG
MLSAGTEAEGNMRFQDRGVLVTGGGSGIGQQVCYAAAEEGARIAVGDLDMSPIPSLPRTLLQQPRLHLAGSMCW